MSAAWHAVTSPWGLLCMAAYALLVGLALGANHAAHRKPNPTDDGIRQPDARDWYCSDGRWRTEAEAADWCAEEDGSDATWLDAWPTGEDIPDYVPQEWVA